jgi:hypothetical protein
MSLEPKISSPPSAKGGTRERDNKHTTTLSTNPNKNLYTYRPSQVFTAAINIQDNAQKHTLPLRIRPILNLCRANALG